MEAALFLSQAALERVEGLPWHGRQDSALDCAGAPSSPRMSATEAFSPSRVWVGVYEPGPSLAGVEPQTLDLGRWMVLDLNA